jgi:hypothetical protein
MGWDRTPPHELPTVRPVNSHQPKRHRSQTLREVNAELSVSRDELRRRVRANTLQLTGREVI